MVCVHPYIHLHDAIHTTMLCHNTQEGGGTVVETTSGLYESKAQYVTDQPDFLNALCRVRTALDPPALLAALKRLERQLGRVPSRRCVVLLFMCCCLVV